MIHNRMFNSYRTTCHHCCCNQSSHIKMIWNHFPCCTSQFFDSMNSQTITSNSFYFCSHTDKHITQILRMWLTSSIVNLCLPRSHHSHQNQILSSCYRRKPLPYFFSFQVLCHNIIISVNIFVFSSKFFDIFHKRIHWTGS